MLNAKAFANAAAVVMAGWVVFCTLLSYLAPDVLFTVAQSWMHNISLEPVRAAFNPNPGSLILGLVSALALTWVTTYTFALFYNRLAGK